MDGAGGAGGLAGCECCVGGAVGVVGVGVVVGWTGGEVSGGDGTQFPISKLEFSIFKKSKKNSGEGAEGGGKVNWAKKILRRGTTT